MPIPTFDQFISPLLQYLAEVNRTVSTKEVYDALAERLHLSAEDRARLLPSGTQAAYKNRIGWAHDALKRNKLSSSSRRGLWRVTEQGLELAKSHPQGLSDEEEKRIAYTGRPTPIGELTGQAQAAVEETPHVPATAAQTPQDMIDNGLLALRARVAQDLLEEIERGSPEFFERLVLDLLFSMGYGESREALQHVGGSGDGGIDGIISLDRLGLEKVYVQAKKWQGSVGSPQIQGFMGALQLKGADKGVLITSGDISKPAQEAARQARGSIVLIDGQRLAELMIENGVGVSHRSVKIPEVDTDYFEEE